MESLGGLSEFDWELFEERAAIAEYDGGMPRLMAEAEAAFGGTLAMAALAVWPARLRHARAVLGGRARGKSTICEQPISGRKHPIIEGYLSRTPGDYFTHEPSERIVLNA